LQGEEVLTIDASEMFENQSNHTKLGNNNRESMNGVSQKISSNSLNLNEERVESNLKKKSTNNLNSDLGERIEEEEYKGKWM
jgi:hypothetical protein